MPEISNYQNNLKSFLKYLEGSYIEKLLLEEDLNPTFDKNIFPFKFSYCHSISFITSKGNFQLYTSATSYGYETFWTQNIASKQGYTSEKAINSSVESVSISSNFNGLPYKFSIYLKTGILIFVAAEIYDSSNAKYSIKMNDEMIFVFDSDRDAVKFEESENYA
jgi:hypothetical protein